MICQVLVMIIVCPTIFSVCVCVCVVFDLPISYTFRMHTTCCHVHGPKMSSVSQSMTSSALGSRGPTLQLTPPFLPHAPYAMHMAGEREFTVFNHHLKTFHKSTKNDGPSRLLGREWD